MNRGLASAGRLGWLQQPRTWRAEVFAIALFCAIPTTLIDTYLLDRKLGIISGGYLAEHQLRGPHLALFGVLGVFSNMALLAPIIAAVLWVSRLLWMHALSRMFLAISAGLGVMAVADVAVYELQRYLGDLVNADVLVNLVGGDIREILFFSVSPALHWLRYLSLGALLVLGAGLLLERRFHSEMRQDPGARRTTFIALVVALAIALGAGGVARSIDPGIDRAMSYTPSGRVLAGLTQWLTDVDRDGFGFLAQPPDPAPFNPAVHPYALDVPNNGIDEDGIGGDLPAGPSHVEPEYPPVTFVRRPDVVFVILETFRADAVGALLDGRPVTPTLDRLRRAGVQARRAYSHNGFTIQSRYHAFTGRLLGPGNPGSLIDDFNANGYETAFFSAQDESFGQDFDVGFTRAAVRYDARVDRDKRFTQFATPSSLTVSWKVLEGRVDEFLDRRSSDVPLFLHLNIQDGHFPYTNPDIEPLLNDVRLGRADLRPDRADDLRRMYLNTLANVDAALGRMLTRVEDRTGRRPAVVVIADHGESLFDEGFLGHGYAANDAQTRIPFIVTGLPVRIPDPVGQWDVRRLVRAALTGPDGPPVLEEGEGRPVFQYIGTIERPKEIALVDRRRWRVGLSGSRSSSDALTNEERSLVHFWERANAARPAASR